MNKQKKQQTHQQTGRKILQNFSCKSQKLQEKNCKKAKKQEKSQIIKSSNQPNTVLQKGAKQIHFATIKQQDDSSSLYLRKEKNQNIISPTKLKGKVSKQGNFNNVLKKYRVNNLVHHFISKIKRTSVYRAPVVFEPFNLPSKFTYNYCGLQLNKFMQTLMYSLSILITYVNCFMCPLQIVFENQFHNSTVQLIQLISILWYSFQIVTNFILVREKDSRKIYALSEICQNYMKSQLIIDLLTLISLVLSYSRALTGITFIFSLLIFVKLPDSFKKFKKIENKVIQYFYQHQYWGLVKMVSINFVAAHFIAFVMILMVYFNHEQNWMTKKGIQNTNYSQKYIWALYWGTTTMLSIGYGDIVPANHQQALTLVFVQIVSCLALAYNINCIGILLAQIRQNQKQKQQKIKVLNEICNKNQIERDLQFRLNTHIQQSYKMKNKLKFNEYLSFLNKLPQNLKQQFLRQSNKKLVSNLTFIRNFTNKTILNIAQKLQQKIIQPWQIAFKPQLKQFVLLKQGRIGLCPKFGSTKFQQVVVQQIEGKLQQNFRLLSLQFVNRYHRTKNYDHKSIGFSIISYINLAEFQEILKRKKVDLQFYFSFRDKQRKDLQQFQVFFCKQCKSNHTKFSCPLLHYAPIGQQVINKDIAEVKFTKTSRRMFKRIKEVYKPLKIFQHNCEIVINSSQGQQRQKQQQMSKAQSDNKMISIKRLKSNLSSKKVCNYPRSKTLLMISQQIHQQVLGFLEAEKSISFWTLETDIAHDYQFYFPSFNPNKFTRVQLNSKKSFGCTNKKLFATNTKIKNGNTLKNIAK